MTYITVEQFEKIEQSMNSLVKELQAQKEQNLHVELTLSAAEKKIKQHEELLKNQTKILVACTDLIQQIRTTYHDGLLQIKNDQQLLMQSFQKLLSGSMETIRSEVLLALRDFREKYPKLETLKFQEAEGSKKKAFLSQSSIEEFSEIQAKSLDRRFDEITVLVERQVQESFKSIVELLSFLLTRVEELNRILEDKSISIKEF